MVRKGDWLRIGSTLIDCRLAFLLALEIVNLRFSDEVVVDRRDVSKPLSSSASEAVLLLFGRGGIGNEARPDCFCSCCFRSRYLSTADSPSEDDDDGGRGKWGGMWRCGG